MAELSRRFLNVAIAVDQLLWVLVTLGHGSPDETLSAAAWRLEQAGRWQGRLFRPLIDGLFLVITFGRDKTHCKSSFDSEAKRRHLPAEYQA